MSKKLYNYDCPIHKGSTTGIINGCTEGIINLNRLSYPWAYNLWEMMLANTWFPREVDLTEDARDYRNLLPAEKRMYDKALSQLIFMDSIQTNNTTDNVNPWVTAPEVNMCLIRQAFEECLTAGHEVLTPKGWKDISKLDEDEVILAFDKDTRGFKWSKIDKYYKYEYTGTLHHFQGRYIDQIVTSEHRMPYIDRNGEIKVKKAKEFPEGNQGVGFIGYGYGDYSEISYLTPYERFLIILQADGTIKRETEDGKYKNRNGIRKGTITCSFTFARSRKIIRFIDLLKELGFEYKVRSTGRGRVEFNVEVPIDKPISKNFKEWVELEKINYIKALDFINELINWDGYRYLVNGSYVIGYDTTVKDNADIIEQIATLAGFRINNHTRVDNRSETFNDLYRLSFTDKDIARGTVIKTEIQVTEPVDVYCVSIDTTFFLVKHNNKISITGNSIHAQSYAVMVDSISINTDEIYDMWKTDPELRKKNEYIGNIYMQYGERALDGDDRAKVKMIVANQNLEGVYFYSGFSAFYVLARAGKMKGSSQMIKFIQRDEVTHTTLFANIFNEIRKEQPQLFDSKMEKEIKDDLYMAYELERDWGNYITNDEILGLSNELIDRFVKYLVNKRCNAMHLDLLFPDVGLKNPITWFDSFSSFNEQKTNFFEANVNNYSKGNIDLNDF